MYLIIIIIIANFSGEEWLRARDDVRIWKPVKQGGSHETRFPKLLGSYKFHSSYSPTTASHHSFSTVLLTRKPFNTNQNSIFRRGISSNTVPQRTQWSPRRPLLAAVANASGMYSYLFLLTYMIFFIRFGKHTWFSKVGFILFLIELDLRIIGLLYPVTNFSRTTLSALYSDLLTVLQCWTSTWFFSGTEASARRNW